MLYYLFKIILTPFLWLIYRPKVEGKVNFNAIKTGSAIIVCNHVQLVDPLILAVVTPFRKIRFMAKAPLFKNPVLAAVLRGVHAFPVERGKADIKAIKRSIKELENKHVFGIFPEGTRNKKDRGLMPFHKGVAIIALKSGAPIIPVVIHGKYGLFKRIRMSVLEPVSTKEYQGEGLASEKVDALISAIRGKMLDALVKHEEMNGKAIKK
ncbi:MAG: lysophospholipid acyltransferase family protein [Christensenellales bacterium]|jgi:1-acyl-sn-glycerol-3-phosphate acyltransferase